MFDIRDYFESEPKAGGTGRDIVNIDDDITHDIHNLLGNRFDSLYRRDRYKHAGGSVEIIHPALQYPGGHSILPGPDRIRYLLSFYPHPADLENLDKIVIRPRFIEIGAIELVALYLRKKGILVLYLYHPHFYRMKYAEADGGLAAGRREAIMRDRLTDDTVRRDGGDDVFVHPLWYFLSIVHRADDGLVDKFFIRKDAANDRVYRLLNDVSLYYSRHGY